MTYEGYFIDIENTKKYYVKIGNGIGVTREIQDNNINFLNPDEIICFSGDEPVTISYDMSDTFEHVYIRTCSINLLSNFDVRKYLVAKNYTDIPVEVRMAEAGNEPASYSNWTIIFSGYVQPMSFNQPFALEWNEFTLECTDKLGLLEYQTFYDKAKEYFTNYFSNQLNPPADIPSAVEQQLRAYRRPIGTNTSSPENIGVFDIIFSDLNFSDIQYNIYYDYTQSTKVNPVIFYGDSEDDYMSCLDVIEEIGKIYGVYIYQNSNYVRGENILLMDLTSTYEVQKEDIRSDDSNISVDEAYKLIKCSVDISNVDNDFINPFDEDLITPTTLNPERIYTELMVKGDDFEHWNTFRALVMTAEGRDLNYNINMLPAHNWQDFSNNILMRQDVEIYDHYCQILKSDLLDFGTHSYLTDGGGTATIGARNTLDWLKANPGKGALLNLGQTTNVIDIKNNTAISLKDLNQTLVIQIGGHTTNTSQESARLETQINNNIPICSYKQNTSINVTPNDKSTTNYLVINGTIRLNPVTPKTGIDWSESDWARGRNTIFQCNEIWKLNKDYLSTYFWLLTADASIYKRWVSTDGSEDNRYYYQAYTWDQKSNPYRPVIDGFSYGELYWPFNQDPITNVANMFIPTNKLEYKKFKWQGSYYIEDDASEIDNISRIPILACELSIGTGANKKYLCEDVAVSKVYTWETPNKQALLDIYHWCTASEAASRGYNTSFFLCVDPKIGDYIIGQDLKIQNTCGIDLNIDESGFALPIPYNTNLSGPVEFRILGPVNSTWDEVGQDHKHFLFWNWDWETTHSYYPILTFVENIFISDFEIKIASDNGGVYKNGNNDNDLVYYSINNETYQNEEEFDCKFCTALTSEEVRNLGVDYEINNSSILNLDDTNFYGMKQYKDTTYSSGDNNYIKLEEARVSEQYNIWKRPRNIIELTMRIMNPEQVNDKTNFTFDFLPNDIYRITSKEIDLKLNQMKVKMKDYSEQI